MPSQLTMDRPAWEATENTTVAVAVAVVSPLTRVTLACQGPLGRLLGGANVTFPDWPGARVMTCCSVKGPAAVSPGRRSGARCR